MTITRSRIETSIPRKHGPAIAGYESVRFFFFSEFIFPEMKLSGKTDVLIISVNIVSLISLCLLQALSKFFENVLQVISS